MTRKIRDGKRYGERQYYVVVNGVPPPPSTAEPPPGLRWTQAENLAREVLCLCPAQAGRRLGGRGRRRDAVDDDVVLPLPVPLAVADLPRHRRLSLVPVRRRLPATSAAWAQA